MMNNSTFEQLYEKYYKIAYLYTYSLCQHREVTEDIVSQAFLNAYLKLDDEIDYFKYWILRVCKNLWINYNHKSKRLLPLPDNDMVSIIMDSPLDIYLLKESTEELDSAIQKMPPNYYKLLMLYYFSELSIHEIADMLELSYSSTKNKLSRARLRLKKVLVENHFKY